MQQKLRTIVWIGFCHLITSSSNRIWVQENHFQLSVAIKSRVSKVQSKENLEQLEERAAAASFKTRLDSDLNIGLIATKRREKSDENCGDRDLYMSIGNWKTEQFFFQWIFLDSTTSDKKSLNVNWKWSNRAGWHFLQCGLLIPSLSELPQELLAWSFDAPWDDNLQ